MSQPLFDLSKRPTRHSYSSLKDFKACAAAYGYRHIMKMVTPSTGAMDRGTRLHKLCEDYLNSKGEMQAPYDIKRIALRVYNLRAEGAKAEETWLLDKNWEPTDDPNTAKLKAIVDVHVPPKEGVLKLHDYKSGREYPEHADQLELYALIGLRRFPDAKRAESSAIYIDSGVEGPARSILRDMFPHYAKRWVALIESLDSERQFLPTPGNACGRCNFRSDKGGPCHEWSKVKP